MFQVEIIVIFECASENLKHIHILSGSQATLKILHNLKEYSRVVMES